MLLATVLLAAGWRWASRPCAPPPRPPRAARPWPTHRAHARGRRFLRRRLASAQPLAFGQDEDNGGALRFIGEPDRIRFVADLPSYLGRGGPHLHDISVEGRGDGAALAVSFTMVTAGDIVVEDRPRPPEPLVAGLTGLRIRYRGLDPETGDAEWFEAWDEHEALPLQVSIEIESAEAGHGRRWWLRCQAADTPQLGAGRARGIPRGGLRPGTGRGTPARATRAGHRGPGQRPRPGDRGGNRGGDRRGPGDGDRDRNRLRDPDRMRR